MNVIGSVEVLQPRIYNTERGEYAVSPGLYPVFWDENAYRFSVLFEGRSTQWEPPSFETIGEGTFAIRPGGDRPTGDRVRFPYGYWNRSSFADLLADPVCAEGDPMQRLRFNLTAEVFA